MLQNVPILVLGTLIESSCSFNGVCCYCCSDNQSICNDNSTCRQCTHAVAGCKLVCNTSTAGGAEPTCAHQPAGTVVDVPGTDCSFHSASCAAGAWSRVAACGRWYGHSLTAATPASACCSAASLCTDGRRTISSESKSISMKCCTNYLTRE